jgi:hypothetical protein
MEASKASDENQERTIDLMIEQSEIIEQLRDIYEKYKGRGYQWNRFRGNTVSNIVAHYLGKRLPSNVRLVKLGLVEGCPTEFDILVVNEDARPINLTDAYPKEQVRLLIEIKSSGVYFKRGEVRNRMSEMFERYKADTGKPVLYFTMWEAKAHVEEVQDALGNDTAYTLRIEGEDMDYGTFGEWERFLDRVTALLESCSA